MRVILGMLLVTFSICLVSAQDESERLERMAKRANVIAVVQVNQLGTPPGFWSGLFPAFQAARYTISDVIKGEVKEDNICVKHPVVKNSKTADSVKPGLSPLIFSEENKLLVFLEETPEKKQIEMDGPKCKKRFQTFDENYGILVSSSEILERVRHLIK